MHLFVIYCIITHPIIIHPPCYSSQAIVLPAAKSHTTPKPLCPLTASSNHPPRPVKWDRGRWAQVILSYHNTPFRNTPYPAFPLYPMYHCIHLINTPDQIALSCALSHPLDQFISSHTLSPSCHHRERRSF